MALLSPLFKKKRKFKFTFKKITPENKHEEINVENEEGNEKW